MQLLSPCKAPCFIGEEPLNRLCIVAKVEHIVPDLPERIGMSLHRPANLIGLWDQLTELVGPLILQEQAHPDFLEAFAGNSKEAKPSKKVDGFMDHVVLAEISALLSLRLSLNVIISH